MQGLYQWQLAGADAASIERDMSQAKGFEKLDREYFSTLLAGAIRHAPQLEAALEPLLDRSQARLEGLDALDEPLDALLQRAAQVFRGDEHASVGR